jgi:5-(hydroxymethyl)furfural/furfural oxidase
MSDIWSRLGYPYVPDLNGAFADGHGPVPVSNDGAFRSSTARQYLNADVRARPNLKILTETRAMRVRLEDGRALGIEALRGSESISIDAERVILCAGALKTPHLLMLSGVGDGEALSRLGISTVSHRPGVGRNLQDHPNIVVSGCLDTGAGKAFSQRSVLTYLRYSSGLPGCEPSDMVMSVRGRSMWHAVGARICGLVTYITLPYSRGSVTLATADPLSSPAVDFNGMDDERDRARMIQGARLSARIMFEHLGPDLIADVFPARLSRRIERLSRPTRLNDLLARTGALLMDTSPIIRNLIVRHVITNGEKLADILADEIAVTNFVHQYLGTSWHPCGTCRMGSPTDPAAVTDPRGAVLGTHNLFVADASLMPRVTRTNTNLPTIMMAERLSELIQA